MTSSNAVRLVLPALTMGLVGSPALAASYGCGRLPHPQSREAAALVLLDGVDPSAARETSPAGSPARLAVTICGPDGCGRAIPLGSARPLALGWRGGRLTVFADPPPPLRRASGSIGHPYAVDARPLADADGSGMELLRFDASQCRRRPSAGR